MTYSTCLLDSDYSHVSSYFQEHFSSLNVLFIAFDFFEVVDIQDLLLEGFTSPQLPLCDYCKQVHYQLWLKNKLPFFIVLEMKTNQWWEILRLRSEKSIFFGFSGSQDRVYYLAKPRRTVSGILSL